MAEQDSAFAPGADTPTASGAQTEIAQALSHLIVVDPSTQLGESSKSALAADGIANAAGSTTTTGKIPNGQNPKLRYLKPYWWPYKTFVKERWIGRQLLEVVSTEFRDRSVAYYRHAMESGVTRVNGAVAYPETVLRNGDRIDNTVHRHEPPITNQKVLILHIDREKEFIVISKPGSMPVHAAGRYFRHTMLELLKADYGINAYAVNRLDRLTSGLMILALSGPASRRLADEFLEGTVQKEYVARVRGEFPTDEITVDQPLITVDRQTGLVIIAPEGKEAKTIFNRMSYDRERDQSVIHCKPVTGRTHQIRVHLQYLGYPIANDPLYGHAAVWGPNLGQGGIELVEQVSGQFNRKAAIAARVAAAALASDSGSATPASAASGASTPATTVGAGGVVTDDRDYENIDVTSPIRLSQQARDVIAKLRRMRDEQEDWVKWKEVVFGVKEAQDELESKAGGETLTNEVEASVEGSTSIPAEDLSKIKPAAPIRRPIPHPRVNSSRTKAVVPDPLPDDTPSPLKRPSYIPDGFCTQCFVPIADDPDPESLFIYLHALRYTTENMGTWETPVPRWAGENWDGDWRGWVDGTEVEGVI